MSNLENLLHATHEAVNYAQYEANETIGIDKYLGEAKRGIFNIIAGAQIGETHLLIAPTGSGKSYEIINTLKEFNVKALFILPNSANVQQAMQEYNIHGAYDKLCAKSAIANGNVVVMTWDKVSQLTDIDLSEHIIVIDEIHQTYTDTYRSKAIKGLYDVSRRCKGRVDITATPNKLDFGIYDYIVEYKQIKQTKYNVKMYNGIDTKAIINILNNSNNSALLMNDTKELKYIDNMINKKSNVITAETKEYSKLYEKIMYESNMGDFESLLNTTTIVAGVNIKNPNITDIIVVGLKDIGTIKQYVARFRDLEQCNIHIFNNYKEECNTYEVEWLVQENIKKANILKDAYNLACNGDTEFSTLGLNINPINLDTNIYFNKDTNSYEVDNVYIKSQIYRKYYNSRTFESFKILLEEYFENIELIYDLKVSGEVEEDKKQYKEYLKKSKEEAVEKLEKHKKILVGYDEIIRDKRSYRLMEYQNINGLSIDHIQKEYLKYDINNLIVNNTLKSMIKLYSKYVLENGFSTDIAWKLANMGNAKRGSIFAKINTLIYKQLKEEHPNIFKNDYSLEVRVYEWLINEFCEGISYTNEHLEVLAEAFKITFGDNWALNTNKIGRILNQIYNIERVKINSSVARLETLFYRDIIPNTATTKKRIDVNLIKSRINLLDIKTELGIKEQDKSLDLIIQKRKAKVLEKLNDIEKEILLEGVF